jgi:hypothetical protein
MTCACATCAHYAVFKDHMQRIPEGSRAFLAELYDDLMHTQMDLSFYRSIADGTWPTDYSLNRHDDQMARSRAVLDEMTAILSRAGNKAVDHHSV